MLPVVTLKKLNPKIFGTLPPRVETAITKAAVPKRKINTNTTFNTLERTDFITAFFKRDSPIKDIYY